jgi:hypothetical protein
VQSALLYTAYQGLVRRDLMPPELNWTEGEVLRSVNHTSHDLSFPANGTFPPAGLDELYWRLTAFVGFNGNHNHVAVVHVTCEGNVRYAWFDMGGLSGKLSKLMNGPFAPVRVWCDVACRLVVGDTAEGHMLIGQRRWTLEQNGSKVSLKTEAYERPNGLFNRLGAWLLGKARQAEVWRAYFQNILDWLETEFGLGGAITVGLPEEVQGNPWSPQEPYPGCACEPSPFGHMP